MILITGASGNLGTAVIEHLLQQVPAHTIAGLCRNKNKAEPLAVTGISVRMGDYADKASLVKVFEGVEKLLLISSSNNDAIQEHKNVVDAAKECGVSSIYYTSGALNKSVNQSKLGPLADSYMNTENYIFETGITYTIFQNGLYAETIPAFIGEQVLETGIYFPAGNGKSSFAKRAEMGEAIANVLAGEGHENKIYVTTVQDTHSFSDIAIILSELSGKKIAYHSPNAAEYELHLRAMSMEEMDIWYCSTLAAIIKNSEYEVSSPDLEKLLGRTPTGLRTYLKETFLS